MHKIFYNKLGSLIILILFLSNVNCRSQNSQSDSPKSNNSKKIEGVTK